MRATMLLLATSNGVGVNVRLIWEWMDRLCKGLSIPKNQGIYRNLCGGNGVSVLPYAHPQLFNVFKHLIYI